MKGPDSQVGTGFRALLSPSLWRASVLLWVVWGGFNFAISGFTAFLPQLLDDDANITACTQDTAYTVMFKPTWCVCTGQGLFVCSSSSSSSSSPSSTPPSPPSRPAFSPFYYYYYYYYFIIVSHCSSFCKRRHVGKRNTVRPCCMVAAVEASGHLQRCCNPWSCARSPRHRIPRQGAKAATA